MRNPKSVSEPKRLTPKVLPFKSCAVAISGVVTRLMGITLIVVPIVIASEPDNRDSAAAAPEPWTICVSPESNVVIACAPAT